MKYCIIFLVIVLLGITWARYSRDGYKHALLNIYGQPLKGCKQRGMENGSWDEDGKCSEQTGGVHQICVKRISENAPKFSKQTGQSDWSDSRGKNNHCVCLGAWSLYSATQDIKDNILQCDAIPDTVFSERYIDRFSEGWNKWNCFELPDQIVHGVESLVNQCKMTPNKKYRKRFIKNYCRFSKKVNSLKDTDTYRHLCKNIN
jgi:hypothetical protein